MLDLGKEPPPDRQANAADAGARANGSDNETVRAHVAMLHELAKGAKGKFEITSRGEDPATGEKLPSRIMHFSIGDVDATVAGIAKLAREQHHNVCISLTIVREGLPPNTAGDVDKDAAVTLGAGCGFDGPVYRERLPVPPDLVLETSPGHFACFIFYDKPLPVKLAGDMAKKVQTFTGCDTRTLNVQHEWPVPGLSYHPTAEEIREGYLREPHTVRAVEPWAGTRTNGSDLCAAMGTPTQSAGDHTEEDHKGDERTHSAGKHSDSGAADRFAALAAAGYLDCLLPILPPDASVSKGSKVKRENYGKVPGLYDPHRKAWVGYVGWTTKTTTLEMVAQWDGWEREYAQAAGIGLRLGKGEHKFQAADHDEDFDAELVAEVRELRTRCLGDTLDRGRPNTPRTLALYRTAEKDEPLGKHCIAYTKDGREGAFEWLGLGQMCVILGRHKSGSDYSYPPGRDPVTATAAKVTVVSSHQIIFFLNALEQLLIRRGYAIKDQSRTGAHSERYVIGDKRLMSRDFEKLARAVRTINWSDLPYHEWITLLRACKQACGGSAEFFAKHVLPLNLDYPGNDETAVEDKWASFRDSSIGADTVYSIARKDGFTEPSERTAAWAEMDDVFARYVFLREQDAYLDTLTRKVISAPVLDKTHPVAGDPAKLRERASYQYTLGTAQGQRRYLDNLTYWPGQDLIVAHGPERLANTWRPSEVLATLEGDKPVPDSDVVPYLDLLNKVFPDKSDQQILLDKMTHALRCPGDKPNWHLLLLGPYGIGKDTILHPMFYALGDNGLSIEAEKMVGTDFNEWRERQHILVTEVHAKDGQSLFQKLKSSAASSASTWVAVNAKNRRTYTVPDTVGFWLTTNDGDALGLDLDDRRFCVLRSPMTAAEARTLAAVGPDDAPSYFTRLYQWLKDGGARTVARWLLSRPLAASFNAQGWAPMTDAKRDMVLAVMSPAQRWIVEQLREEEGQLRHDLVTLEEVIRLCERSLPESMRRAISFPSIVAALKVAGARPLGRVRLGGRTVPQASMWSLRSHELYSQLRPTELRAAYLIDRQTAAAAGPEESFEPAPAIDPSDDPRLKFLLS